VYAMFSIGDLRQLVGENYKDKNECAKVIATIRSHRNDSPASAGNLSRTLRRQ
jgi:hypothetical protein